MEMRREKPVKRLKYYSDIDFMAIIVLGPVTA